MPPHSRRKFLKSVTAASVVSTLGNATFLGTANAASCPAVVPSPLTVSADMAYTLGIIGDEVTASFYSTEGTPTFPVKARYMAKGYITWALALSRQRLRIASIQAKPGAMVSGTAMDNFTSQMQACLDAQVSDIICMGGQRDLEAGVSLSDLKAAWTCIIGMASAHHRRVWWLTQTPADQLPPAKRADVDQLNKWILEEAPRHDNVIAIDVAADSSVSVAGNGGRVWKPGNVPSNSKVSVMPINVGAYRIGKIVAAAWTNAIPDHFVLATDEMDDIENDPRSYNIIHNSLLNDIGVNRLTLESGGNGYKAVIEGRYFPLEFTGGVGSGAMGLAEVSSSGAIIKLIITHAGLYTEAPTISFDQGGGRGASATAELGIAGFVPDQATTVEQVPREQYGHDAKLTIQFEPYLAKHGVNYDYTLNADMLKHIGPQDSFAIRCEVRRSQPLNTLDQLGSVGPVIQISSTPAQAYESCGDSPDDQPLPEAFDAVFLTPPIKYGNPGTIRFFVQAANGQNYAKNVKTVVQFGRVSCLVQPSLQFAPVIKEAVKFNPGHYVTVYHDWLYGAFNGQDSFSANGSTLTPTTAAWSGVEKPITWKVLENQAGNYNFAMIRNWLDNLRDWNAANPTRNPKRLIVYLLSDSYTESQNFFLPDDISADDWYPNGKGGKKLKLFEPRIQDRLIALGQRLAQEFDQEPLFEAFRLDETSPGDLAKSAYAHKATAHVEGQIRVAVEINRAFRHTMCILGFNFVADQKYSRAARLLTQAGVGMGAVDLVPIDKSLASPYQSYDFIKAASRYVPSVAHFDGGNYVSNDLGNSYPQPLSEVTPFALARLNASHICWYRKVPKPDVPVSEWPRPLYWDLTAMLNAMQSDWDSVAGRSGGLSTVRPLSLG